MKEKISEAAFEELKNHRRFQTRSEAFVVGFKAGAHWSAKKAKGIVEEHVQEVIDQDLNRQNDFAVYLEELSSLFEERGNTGKGSPSWLVNRVLCRFNSCFGREKK